ncbi:hypothetical protein MKEN_00076500 [Mycena kentingensis (nom. inval.)]|nr:hypothetical protein MKEN_00076500 [Mycena kentingensis (nom. inval.)]
MHSPQDSGSSSPASDVPDDRDMLPTGGPSSHIFSSIASHLSSSFSSPSKRRLPGGSSSYASSSSRDIKSRRRDDPRRGAWDNKEGGKRDKEELIDNHVVDTLRKEIGDPFMENPFKQAA